ncbi:DNA -binding domain-containing protein [Sphingomonas soli]|uniref:DNA -binding domain-containing protein n=1 Tax=Sphingomonas soli TaxID=266127 RepID=UPI000833453F|nr:DUF2285 domain-containing protein [Sphingomonas soli]
MPAYAASGLAKHDRADFAQEYLRRNAAYRAAWRASHRDLAGHEALAEARRWGLIRLFDPDRAVRAAPAIWRADCASQIVPLVAAPARFSGAAPLPGISATAEFAVAGMRHLVFDIAGTRHRFEVREADRGALAILLPPLGNALATAACDAARRMLAGLRMAETVRVMRPSALQRQRLALLLRVLDASLGGATNRAIGTQIVYPWLAGTDAIAWKATSERRRVQRLVDEAHGLAASAYRDMLIG